MRVVDQICRSFICFGHFCPCCLEQKDVTEKNEYIVDKITEVWFSWSYRIMEFDMNFLIRYVHAGMEAIENKFINTINDKQLAIDLIARIFFG